MIGTMKRISVYFAAALAALVSCQKTDVESVNENQEISDMITAVIEDDSSSRTALDLSDRSVRWSSQDQIAAFMQGTQISCYSIRTASVGQKAGEFDWASGAGPDSAGGNLNHNVAFYPYQEGISVEYVGESYVLSSVMIPQTQAYAAGTFGNGAFPMVAVSETRNLTFRNICGTLRLSLKGKQKVASIKVSGNDSEKLSGNATLTAYPDDREPKISMSDDAAGHVLLDCAGGVQLSEATAVDFFVVLPPVVFEKGFTATVTDTDGNVVTLKSAAATEMKRSAVLNMPPVSLPAPPDKGIDLSLNGTANSYIVEEPGRYSFPTVKGNSNESVGEVASATVLWESLGTSDYLSVGCLVTNVSASGGFISFETASKFKEGNAVIAAKDSQGTILWSWHIWITDQPQPQTYANDAGVMMDRNLGAYSAEAGSVGALGLLYQWGRKDPFLASSKVSDIKQASSTITWPEPVTTSAETGTVEFATANPTTYIMATDKTDYDWIFAARDNSLWTSEKTIYDPCPAGWRVPDGDTKGIWRKAGLVFTEYDGDSYGISFSISDSDHAWYPTSGIIDYNGLLGFCGEFGFYWSVTASEYMSSVACFRFDEFSVKASGASQDRSYAFSVRCVQDSE